VAAAPPMSKAAGFNSYIETARTMLGDRWPAVVALLSTEARAVVEKPPIPVTWLPDTHWNEVTLAMRKVAFADSPEGIGEIGRRQMHRDLSTIYKALMHLVSPTTVIKKAATIYATYTKNGRMSARAVADGVVEVRIDDMQEVIPEVWFYHVGSITGTLECTGAKNVRVTVKEGGGLSSYCVYEARWG
jgi:uncharacterized protein (TIGR02265 family)